MSKHALIDSLNASVKNAANVCFQDIGFSPNIMVKVFE